VKAVYGLYPDGASAQQAVDSLRAAGLSDREITVLSSQPMEEYEFGQADKKTWMWWIACGGALVGMASAMGLSWLTETSWPIDVGGLPTFAWWPNLIITFELTMLGAMLATAITFFFTAIFPGQFRSPHLYDAEVSDGHILVGVERAQDETRVAQVLASAGGRVKDLAIWSYRELHACRRIPIAVGSTFRAAIAIRFPKTVPRIARSGKASPQRGARE